VNVVSLELDVIGTDGGTQSRATVDHVVALEYAELMMAGTIFPAVIVIHRSSRLETQH
jgi:hypothetical protein